MNGNSLLQLPLWLLLATSGMGQDTSLISASSSGELGNSRSQSPRISADGSCVVFESLSTNLTPGITAPYVNDIFARDIATNTTSRISFSSFGGEPDGSCAYANVSADGRFVSFSSTATNLVPGDSNGTSDVFLLDRQSGQLSRVSLGSTGLQGSGGSGKNAISDDGTVIAFISTSHDLVPNDVNQAMDIFVRDRVAGTTTRASLSTTGTQGSSSCYDLALSGNGRYVAFESSASEFVDGDTNGVSDVFVRDLLTQTTTRVSVGPAGVEADGGSWRPSLSADGRFVAFTSFASNLVAGATGAPMACYVHDRLAGVTSLVSVDSSGAPANGLCEDAVLSADGRHVSFSSVATNLVPGDTNAARDIFVHDRLLGLTIRASMTDAEGETDDFNERPSISGDGRRVVFESRGTNVVTGDSNGVTDVFLYDRPINGGGSTCGGNGPAESCPCGNTAEPGEGCNHSGGHGARLGRYGTALAGQDDLLFVADQLPPGRPTLLVAADSLAGAGSGVLFGDGLQCTSGNVVHLGVRLADGAGIASWGPGLIAAQGWAAGDTRTFQAIYRDSAASPCGAGFNTTPAHTVTFH